MVPFASLPLRIGLEQPGLAVIRTRSNSFYVTV